VFEDFGTAPGVSKVSSEATCEIYFLFKKLIASVLLGKKGKTSNRNSSFYRLLYYTVQ
jgi:hypothetical protein